MMDEYLRVREGIAMMPIVSEPQIIMEPLSTLEKSRRGGHRGPHAYNIHNDPSIVNRLIRIIEELLERDDVRMNADNLWYWNRLKEIKEELSNGETQEAPGGAEASPAG